MREFALFNPLSGILECPRSVPKYPISPLYGKYDVLIHKHTVFFLVSILVADNVTARSVEWVGRVSHVTQRVPLVQFGTYALTWRVWSGCQLSSQRFGGLFLFFLSRGFLKKKSYTTTAHGTRYTCEYDIITPYTPHGAKMEREIYNNTYNTYVLQLNWRTPARVYCKRSVSG